MKNKFFILIICLLLIFCQGCSTLRYVKEHPYKSLGYVAAGALIVAGAVAVAYSASKSGSASTAPQSTYVDGYYRSDGTYVRPHYRTYPDDYIDNNYGLPSPQQAEQFKNYKVLPTYSYDFDNDSITNQYDYDDDNDGYFDNYDKVPYNPYYH